MFSGKVFTTVPQPEHMPVGGEARPLLMVWHHLIDVALWRYFDPEAQGGIS